MNKTKLYRQNIGTFKGIGSKECKKKNWKNRLIKQ